MKVLADKEENGQQLALILPDGKDSPEWVNINDVPKDILEKYFRAKKHHHEKEMKEKANSEAKEKKESKDKKEAKPKREKKERKPTAKISDANKETAETAATESANSEAGKPKAQKHHKLKLEKILGISTFDKKSTTFIVKLKDEEAKEIPYSELKKHYSKELLEYLMDHIVLENK